MVADRPGSDPITRPYTDAASIAMITSHVEIRRNASIRVFSMVSPRHRQEDDRQRHPQQLAEDQVDADRRQHGKWKREFWARAERGRGGVDDQRSRDDE